MRRRIWIWVSVPFLALLAGCSGGDGERSLQQETFTILQKEIQSRLARKRTVAPEPVTRAKVEALNISILEVTLERAGVVGYGGLIEARKDSRLGNIAVWRTDDGFSLSTRNGVLVATRGFGGDVLSSQVPVRGTAPGPAFGGEHVQMIRALDDRQVSVGFGCDLVDLGPETLEILGHRHTTRHVQEQCEARKGQVVNDYWVEARTGFVRQSRQWAGPEIGYLKTRRLTD